jgi:S-DNA-T family DNA segregation ATPase FtsK/SpoIIIE
MLGALAIGTVMIAVTRNPIFAALPLLGALGFLGPALAKPRRRVSVIDLDSVGLTRQADPCEDHGTSTTETRMGPHRDALGDVGAHDRSPVLHLAPFPVAAQAGDVIHVGPDVEAATMLVRTWLLAEATTGPPGRLTVQTAPHAPSWAWSRWLDDPRPDLTVIVHLDTMARLPPSDRGEEQTTRHPAVHIVIGGPPPPGAIAVDTHRSGLGLIGARVDGGAHAMVLPLGEASAQELARRLAGRGSTSAAIPDIISALPLDATDQRWADAGTRVPIGIGADGRPIWLDLPSDGPHLLVAGATGSGKSEFLRGLMLASALTSPPDRLVILGIDHKGGATFADLGSLPHLAGVVTDLDTGESMRAVVALGAELTRREQLLARRGLEDLADMPLADRPPRILVVIDEFRNLIETLPDATARLERLAAQGRSLGMHLVLATQRPAGAVSAQLRANLASRVCFRVATDADSMDVIDAADAARIDPSLPGTCYMASSGRPRRIMRALTATSPIPARPSARHWPDRWADPLPGPMASRAQIAEALAAMATDSGYRRASPPWLAPLPTRVSLTEVRMRGEACVRDASAVDPGSAPCPQPIASDGPEGIVVALADIPEHQRQVPLMLSPQDGNVLAIGAPRSGRTTTARTLAVSALEGGHDVQVVSADPEAFADLTDHSRFGTLVGVDDSRRVARLGRLLRDEPATGDAGARPTVLIVDGAETLATMPLPGFDDHPLEALSTGGNGAGLWLVATCLARHAGGRWAGHFPVRLVLPTIDRVEDVAAGVSTQMAGRRRPPGRAIALRNGEEVMVHVAVADSPPAETDPRPAGRAQPPRLAPLPELVTDLPPSEPDWLWFGYGGDDAGPIGTPFTEGHPIGIVGPPGSGRTTVLRSIAAQCDDAGTPPLVLDAAEDPGAWRHIEIALARGRTVVADNLDRAIPAPPALPPTGRLVAALTTPAAGSFQGTGPLLRNRPCGIVLMPASHGSAEAFGIRLTEAIDHRRARTTGFGVVVTPRSIVPVQTPIPRPVDHLWDPVSPSIAVQSL